MADEFTFEATSRFAQLGDMRLHYNEVGEGDALVMLHGGGPGATGWSNFKQNLPAFAKHFRVLLVDQPQFGLSDKPESKEQFNVVAARALRDLLDELDIARAHLLGNSLGGGTAFRFALDYPERAEPARADGPRRRVHPRALARAHRRREDPRQLPRAARPEPREARGLRARDGARPVARHRGAARRALGDGAAIRRSSSRPRQRFLMTVMGPDEEQRTKGEMWREIHNVKHRTLITWGRDDRVLPLDGALFMLHRMDDARLHVFTRCGHWAQLEHAREFERISIDFLRAP